MAPQVKSWTCKGCTNVCYRSIDGETYRYCRPMLEGRHRKEWTTETYIDCLDKTTDPGATDTVVKLYGM